MSLTAPDVSEQTAVLDEHNESTMRAIVQRQYGTADVLHLQEIERPVPGPDEALVRVRAAGLDRGTWHFMTGVPYLGRLAFGLRVPRNPVLGLDVAGTVEAVGSKVTRFKAGDDVFGTAKGTFAEYTVAREDKLAPKPPSLTFEQAAVVPVSASTALQGLRDSGRISSGQTVLIVGASGGVGSYAVQLAKALGAEVTGVASTGKLEFVGSIGADHTIDYTTEGFADGSRRYDLIIDIGGRRKVSVLRRALAPKGTLVLLGGEDGGKLSGGMVKGAQTQFRQAASS
jgi:NADPH:quinone reductase-like Zn-dependent oxidoreductase